MEYKLFAIVRYNYNYRDYNNYRVLQAYAAEGMNRVRARFLGLGLGFAHPMHGT